MESCTIISESTEDRQSMSELKSLEEGPERPLDETIMLRSKLRQRPQNFGNVRFGDIY